MKLTEWAAIAEVLGGVGIIASLVFVGTEIQQNTAAIRTSTIQAIADQGTTINLALATDDRLSELFAQAFQQPENYKNMAIADQLRLGMVLRAQLRRVENIYLHVHAGAVEQEALNRVGYGWYRSEVARQYWENARSGFDAEFAQFMNNKLAEIPSE